MKLWCSSGVLQWLAFIGVGGVCRWFYCVEENMNKELGLQGKLSFGTLAASLGVSVHYLQAWLLDGDNGDDITVDTLVNPGEFSRLLSEWGQYKPNK